MTPMHHRTAQIRFGIVAHSVAAYLLMQAAAKNAQPTPAPPTPKRSKFDTLDKMHASHKMCIRVLNGHKKAANKRKALAKIEARGGLAKGR